MQLMVTVGAQTLEEQIHARDNNYRALETMYRRATGGELVRDPYESVRHAGPPLTLSASIVIPAWNARDTLQQCLIAVEQSSFNCKYGNQLEVIVVDDGSSDGTWELLERLNLNLNLKAVQQSHHSRAQTQNTGIALAEGDVIIACDADMILTPFTIEEMVKRHQVLDKVMLIGFRGDVDRSDPRIQPDVLVESLPRLLPPFTRDVRLSYGAGAWPESMCRDTDHLKRLGEGKQLIMADGGRWNLPGMVYGALFSLRRAEFAAMDGYDERFYGWGCEDTLVGVRALALGNYILPVYSAAGLHIAHGDRSRHKWREFAANRRVFHSVLHAPFVPDGTHWLQNAKTRAVRHLERARSSGAHHAANDSSLYAAFDAEWSHPDHRGKYLHALGRYDEAAAAFGQVRGEAEAEAEAWALFDQGKALRAAQHPDQAAARLEEAATRLPDSAWPPVELALSFAALGKFTEARDRLAQAREIDSANPVVQFLLCRPASKHLERAALYARQEDYALAVRDYEAALILDPHNTTAQVERATALAAMGQVQAARAALSRHISRLDAEEAPTAAARCELGRLHLALGERGAAKVALEQARRGQAHTPEIAARLAEVHATAAQLYPLPLPRAIVEQTKEIPGWLSADEAELLVALTLQAAARPDSGAPPVLLEIGSYCGRATVSMALAVRGLRRGDARIISLDEPSVGPAPGGRPPRAVLRSELTARGLNELVLFAPEDEPAPWEHSLHLLFVDGRHDNAGVRADVERYTPCLALGGLLVFHDYADYFPDVQRCVDELLLDPSYDFVAQAGSLIALVRRGDLPNSCFEGKSGV